MKTRIAAATLLVIAMAGCGSGAQNAASSGGVVKLTFWGEWSGEGEKQIKSMTDAFNKTHPKIQVNYVVQEDVLTKFLTASTSGKAPDLLFWDRWRTATYAPKGVLHPIDDLLKKDNIGRDLFFSEALRELTVKDKLYGLPTTVDARALFYNKKHFKEAGVEPPKTWAELRQVAAKLTKRDNGKLVRAGLSLGDVGLFSMYLRQAGSEMVSPDCAKTAFNSPQGQEVLRLWQDMVKDGSYDMGFETGLQDGTDAFATGKVSMMFTGPWSVGTYQKFGKDLDFGIVEPPTGPTGAKGSGMGGFGLVIPQASKHHDAAWEFVKWWTASKDNSLTWAKTSKNFPGNVQAAQDSYFTGDPLWKPLFDTLQYAKIRPTCGGYAPMETEALIPGLQLFMEGKATPEQALSKAQGQGDKLLAENNQ